MGRHEVSFEVELEREKVYDCATQFFPTLGYRLVSGDRPNTISFKRGSLFGITLKTAEANLTISLIQSGEKVIVKC
jgi:hypothetical protein